MLRTRALLERETLDEGDILEVTEASRPRRWTGTSRRETFGPVRRS